MKGTMKGVVVTTNNRVSIRSFGEPLYRTAKEVLGGYMEIVYPRGLNRPYLMLCNDEGLLQGLPVNIFASDVYCAREGGYPIVGNVIIMKEGTNDYGEPDVIGLEDDEAEDIADVIRNFYGKGKKKCRT